jgi:hypothetical protein
MVGTDCIGSCNEDNSTDDIKEPNDNMEEEHQIIHNAEHFSVKKYISTDKFVICR